MLEHSLGSRAGIRLHHGKTKVWNKAGRVPGEIGAVGASAWSADVNATAQPDSGYAIFKAIATERKSPKVVIIKFSCMFLMLFIVLGLND